MAKMQRQQKQTEDVESRYKIILEAVDHHRVHIIMTERIGFEQRETPVRHSHSEMGEVINDEREHDEPAHHHVTRGERCLHVLPVQVRVRPGTPVLHRQMDRHPDVNNDGGEQEQTDYPKQRTKITQMLRVTIDPIRSYKNLQIPEQMSDDKKDQNDAGNRDDHFLSNRRAIKGP